MFAYLNLCLGNDASDSLLDAGRHLLFRLHILSISRNISVLGIPPPDRTVVQLYLLALIVLTSINIYVLEILKNRKIQVKY